MRLSAFTAVILLIATLLPLAYFVFFFGIMLVAVLGGADPVSFRLMFVLHLLCMLCLWGLIGFYLVYLFRTNAVPPDRKALWAVVLFFGNMFAMPVFWYLYIWTPQKLTANLPQPQSGSPLGGPGSGDVVK